MVATITPGDVTTGIAVYKVNSSESFCEVAATAGSLKCDLTELDAARQYTVEARACGSDGECSDPISENGWTLPKGIMLILHLRKLFITKHIWSGQMMRFV